MKRPPIERLRTGVLNLDEILHGGLPVRSLVVIAGSPGAGKTILSQQIAFHNATPDKRALFVQTLSEPSFKTIRYMQQFSFFDAKKIDKSVHFVDLGEMIREKGLAAASELMMVHIRRVKPAFVVIDSFKVFEDLSISKEELRKFIYQIAVNLAAWECTAMLLGEFRRDEVETSPLFSIVDGIIMMGTTERNGRHQRYLEIVKMRGTRHDLDQQRIEIRGGGVEVHSSPLRKPLKR